MPRWRKSQADILGGSGRHGHGSTSMSLLILRAVNGALVLLLFAEAQVEDVEHVEHAGQHRIENALFAEGRRKFEDGLEEEEHVEPRNEEQKGVIRGPSNDAHRHNHVVAGDNHSPSGLATFHKKSPVAGEGNKGDEQAAERKSTIQLQGV